MKILCDAALDIERDLNTHNLRYPKYRTKYRTKMLFKGEKLQIVLIINNCYYLFR